MATREYVLATGVETSTLPVTTNPSASGDILSKGYADDTYSKDAYWSDAVADTTALKAVAVADRSDRQIRLKEDTGDLWRFDSASSATEDGTTILQPTTGSGRWIVCSGSGGSSGSSTSNQETLETQNQLATLGLNTIAMDNSIRANGLEIPQNNYFTGYLIENYTSGGSTINVVWNPIVIYDSDKDYDSITNWAAVGAGTTLAASAGSNKVGANRFTFNKDNSAVDASIRHTLAAQTLAVGANYRVYFWINLPSITNLSNVFLKIMGAATTDFSRWNLTTDYAGSALAVGWNLCFVDIKNTAASSTGGTPWTYTQLARYVEVGVTTSSAGQTYTAIAFDGLWFSHGDISAWAPKAMEFTGYDTSNKNNFMIDSASTRSDGVCTLASTVAQNYTAGIAAAAAMKLVRSSFSWSQAGLIGFDTTKSSGTIATTQEMRLSRVLRESLSGNYGAYVDMFHPQIYKVSSASSSGILVEDSEAHTANLVSGNQIHIFTTYNNLGDQYFTLLGTRTMTANSSASGGITTLTVSGTSVSAGDYVVKQSLSVSGSVVAATANESYSALSYATTPNGAQLIGANSYPNPSSVYAHWLLGASTDAYAIRDLSGNGRNLTEIGSVNLQDSFKAGKYAASGFTAANYLRTAGGTAVDYDGFNELIQCSFWFYYNAPSGSDRVLVSAFDDTSVYARGWIAYINSTGELRLNSYDSTSDSVNTLTLTNGTWNHCIVQIQKSVVRNIWLNSTRYSAASLSTFPANASTSQALYFGVQSSSGTLDTSVGNPITGLKIADAIFWRNGNQLSQTDVNYLYNSGIPRFYGYNPCILRNEYAMNATSGQKISMKAQIDRTTSAVSPYILQAGMIKTG